MKTDTQKPQDSNSTDGAKVVGSGDLLASYRWTTQEFHPDNIHTMSEYIEYHNEDDHDLKITLVDGTYAEGIDSKGIKWGIHAAGDGDAFNHLITFDLIG